MTVVRMKFEDRIQLARDEDPDSAPGDLVATYPPGHVAQFAEDGSMNVYRRDASSTTTNDSSLPHMARLRNLNERNARLYGAKG